jgi:uroporphyrinogen-III synthase
VTRDEGVDGPLARALRAAAFAPVACPVLIEEPSADPAVLARAAADLDDYAWIVCASPRAVHALASARGASWPPGVRTAAVGPRTAAALRALGASPLVGSDGAGADALWRRLRDADVWPGRRVLVPTTPGGRVVLIDALTAAGARVDAVEAYRMAARPAAAIAETWAAAAPDAAVLASPRVVTTLVTVIGALALRRLHAVVAIGPTTARTLAQLDVPHVVADAADFPATARALAARRTAEAAR